MQKEIEDKTSPEYQRQTWEAAGTYLYPIFLGATREVAESFRMSGCWHIAIKALFLEFAQQFLVFRQL